MEKRAGLLIDDALAVAGSRGRYQKLIFALAFLAGMPNAFTSLHFVFSQFEPVHHCTYPEDFLNFTTKNESTRADVISTIIPLESDQHGKLVPSQCKMYLRNYSDYPVNDWPNIFGLTNGTQNVDCMYGNTYKQDEGKQTATMEFSMVCQDDWKSPFAVSMCHVGILIGSLLGPLADRWGRRPVFVGSCVFQVLGQTLGVLSWNLSSYSASMLIVGASAFVNYIVSFIIVTEVTDCKLRNFTAIASFYAYAIGYCVVALVAYVFQQWRWMLGVMTVLSTLLYAPCCFLFPESPRWLAQKGKSDQAVELLGKIAKANGRNETFEEELRMSGNRVIEKNDTTSTGAMETIKVLFKSGIGGRFLASVYGWTVSSVVYYAIAIYSTDFSTDRFINFLLSGVSEFPAYVISYFLLKYIGRPRTAFVLMMLCGISSLILPFIPTEVPLLSTVLAVIGKMAISGVFYVWYLISCEVIPTLQRSSGVGLCSAGARIGSFFAPYLMHTRKYNYFAANIVLGVLAVSCALTGIFFVPEVLGVNIPDTATEARQNQRLYGLNLCRNFPREKMIKSNIKKMPDDTEEKESML